MIVWAARRLQDLIEVAVNIITAIIVWILRRLYGGAMFLASAFRQVAYVVGVVLVPSGALYVLIRFIKWAWTD